MDGLFLALLFEFFPKMFKKPSKILLLPICNSIWMKFGNVWAPFESKSDFYTDLWMRNVFNHLIVHVVQKQNIIEVNRTNYFSEQCNKIIHSKCEELFPEEHFIMNKVFDYFCLLKFWSFTFFEGNEYMKALKLSPVVI